jgi:hypothetical protein
MIIGSFVVIAINFTDTSCLSSDDKCLLEKAISEGNPNICENSQWCYMKYYSDQDSSVCSSMPDKIDVYGSGVIYYNYRDKCYKYFAYKENNAVLCDLIQRKETRDHCLKDIQLDRENNTVDTKTESDSEVAYIAEPSKDITDRFIHITVEDEVDDQTKDWQVYTNDKLAIQFKYPPNWIARERNTEYNNRIYIENGENKDFVIGGFPKDFATMWFDFKEPSPDSLSYNQLLVRLANFQCNKKYITRGSTNIYMCEFTFDPESEGHVGPRLEALWKHNGIKYSADTSDMVLGTNDWDTGLKQNELEVEVLKNVLSTLVFY